MTSTEKSLLALGVGLAVGVGLGILFAPRKGSETREKIGEGYDECKEKVLEVFDKFKKKAHCCSDKKLEDKLESLT